MDQEYLHSYRIEALIEDENERSIRLATRLGFLATGSYKERSRQYLLVVSPTSGDDDRFARLVTDSPDHTRSRSREVHQPVASHYSFLDSGRLFAEHDQIALGHIARTWYPHAVRAQECTRLGYLL